MAPDRGAVDHVLPVVGRPKFDECLEQCVPNALFCPALESDIDGVPLTIAFMHVAPRATNAQDIQHAVQKTAIVLGWTGLSSTLSRQKRFNDLPFGICQVSREPKLTPKRQH